MYVNVLMFILDQVAIRDFKFGAMETWGLVTYQDKNLLVHPNFTSYSDMMGLARIVSHETVHMVSTL